VIINSSNGEIFKNGVITTDLTAKLYQNGEEIDTSGSLYTYAWTKVDKDGVPSSFESDSKTISVGSSDVTAKATFICTVS